MWFSGTDWLSGHPPHDGSRRFAIAIVVVVTSAGCSSASMEEFETAEQRAIVGGPDGSCTVQSPWVPPYNIVDNHCHHAAAANVDAVNGFIACTSLSWGTGHTVNWAPDPNRPGDPQAFCAYEPQDNGGTSAGGSVCCWSGPANANGTPDLGNAAALACITPLCQGQVSTGWLDTKPVAYPPGELPPLPTDCSTRADRSACASCCDGQASLQTKRFPEFAAQAAAYRLRCRQSCGSTPLDPGATFDVVRPGSNDSRGITQGRICVDDAAWYRAGSYLNQCLSCCASAGYGSTTPGSTTSCEAVCNAAFR